jgi:hypothetical protein
MGNKNSGGGGGEKWKNELLRHLPPDLVQIVENCLFWSSGTFLEYSCNPSVHSCHIVCEIKGVKWTRKKDVKYLLSVHKCSHSWSCQTNVNHWIKENQLLVVEWKPMAYQQ